MSDESDQQTEFPTYGRLLGIDYGTKRVGVAVCDVGQEFSGPLDLFQLQGSESDTRYIQRITEENAAVGFVVGLPVHMSGDESEKSLEAREFGDWLHEVTGLPVRYHDERLTTVAAQSLLMGAELSKKKRKARLDKVAAHIMLQSYLDSTDRDAKPGAM